MSDNEESPDKSYYVAYTPGVGASSRLYTDVLTFETGTVCLVGVNERTWIVPIGALELVKELDEERFEQDPDLVESSGRPQDWPDRRKAILWREMYRCQNCGCYLEKDRNHAAIAHHLVKPEHGGTELLSNLSAMCYGCHGRAHRK